MPRLHACATSIRRVVALALVAGSLVATARIPASAIVYDGAPNLALTSALVAAGGGPEHFSSAKLFKVVTGALAAPEAAKLTKQFGAADVASTFAVFDFAIDDVIRVATAKHIALPPPSPDPADAKALAVALYGAGMTDRGTWDVGYMLEHLITHPIHHVIMADIDAKFGSPTNGTFHMVLAQMMHDLAIAYRPDPSRS
ncbi:MAG: hypothetical protein NVS2B3_19410 [Vulcanimicrobiaceae bacterium]